MKKKVVIFRSGSILENSGGPSGYLYILREGLKKVESDIDVISYSKAEKDLKHGRERNESTTFLKLFIQEIYSCIFLLFYHKRHKYSLYKLLKDFDIIHVHSVENAYSLSKLRWLKGKIILTPHRPEASYAETINQLKKRWSTEYSFPLLKKVYVYIERHAYKATSGFIFPSKGAMNIYKDFPGFVEGSKGKNIKYVYTGVIDKSKLYRKGLYRKKFDLNSSNKVIAYIGRHSSIKGYDFLISNADFFEKNKIHLICAGDYNEKMIPISKYWHECGFISDTYNLLGDADVVVIPNRNTYFDLVIIEALSMGKIVLSTNTGGNIDINLLTEGMILFRNGDDEDFQRKLIEILKMNNIDKNNLEKCNRKFYEKFCTVEQFAFHYIEAIKTMEEGNLLE